MRKLAISALLAAVLLGSVVAPTAIGDIIIDDFDIPALIQSPGGPETVITNGVGDLNATRELDLRLSGPGVPIARADSGVSHPGQYTVDVDDAAFILFVDAKYDFAPADLTESGANNAIFVEFTFEEGEVTVFPDTGNRLQPPGVTIVVSTDDGLLVGDFSNAITSPFPTNTSPYRLTAPFEWFTDRGGGTVDADFSDVSTVEIWLVGTHAAGPWEVRIDSIRAGNTARIPEPTSALLMLIPCVLVACVSRHFVFPQNGA